MCLPEWRNLVCGMMIVILPASLIAQDSGRAMLHSEGGALLNGNPAPNSTAIFSHDWIQTQHSGPAKIDADGATVTIQPDTVVQFEGDEIVLDHGSVQLNTSRAMAVQVNCITVVPVKPEWTLYDVVAAEGKLIVAARRNEVKIRYQDPAGRHGRPARFSDVTVHAGEQITRVEECGKPPRPGGAVAADGAILNSPIAKVAGLAVIGILTCFALCRGDDPVSPSKP